MSDRTLLKIIDPVFSEETRAALYAFLNQPGWEHGWKSKQATDVFSFLHKHFAGHRKSGKDQAYDCTEELERKCPEIAVAWLSLREIAFKDYKLVRCYANGMCYGMDGTLHSDAVNPGNFTFIYYPHERWAPNWGGETIFFNREKTSILGCVYPKPNTAVMFDGRIPHRANGVTRLYPGLRITLMFKMEKIDADPAS